MYFYNSAAIVCLKVKRAIAAECFSMRTSSFIDFGLWGVRFSLSSNGKVVWETQGLLGRHSGELKSEDLRLRRYRHRFAPNWQEAYLLRLEINKRTFFVPLATEHYDRIRKLMALASRYREKNKKLFF